MHRVTFSIKRQHFERLVSVIENPVFLHAEARVKRLLFVAVAAHAAGRDNLHHEIRRSENPALADNAGIGFRDENKVWLRRVFVVKDHVQRRGEHLAKLAMLHKFVEHD